MNLLVSVSQNQHLFSNKKWDFMFSNKQQVRAVLLLPSIIINYYA